MPSPLPADASPASFMLPLTSHLTPTLAFTTHPPTSPLSSPRYDLAFLAPFKLEELPRAQLPGAGTRVEQELPRRSLLLVLNKSMAC